MNVTTVRRVVGATAVVGAVAVLWLLPDGSRTTADTAAVDSTRAVAPLLDLRAEVELLDAPGAAVDANGAVEGHFVLSWVEGGLWTGTYYAEHLEPGFEPPVGFRVKYAGDRWLLTVVAYRSDLQVGRPEVSGITIVATFANMTFANTSGSCEIEILEAPFTVIDAHWLSERSVYYQAEEATARLSCFDMLELRTREPLSIEVAFRLPPSGRIWP
jgi:hypothetical protein